MNTSLFAFALLSTVLAAPAIVESPFGLVATLSSDESLNGYIVLSKDDGSLWLRNPEEIEDVPMLGNMDIEGKVHAMDGSSLYINADSNALTISFENASDMFINNESVLSSGDVATMAACPSEDGHQLFSSSATCDGRVDTSLRAVTYGSLPLTEGANKLDIKQNFCCLKGCLGCGGCIFHGSCSCAPRGPECGSRPVYYPPPPPTPACSGCGQPVGPDGTCTTCGNGCGPIVIGTHVDSSSTTTSIESPTATASHFGNTTTPEQGSAPAGISAIPYYPVNDCGCSGPSHFPSCPISSPDPTPASDCGCAGEYHSPSCTGGHANQHFCPKDKLCSLCSHIPCPKDIFCGLCKARPCACEARPSPSVPCNSCGSTGSCGCTQAPVFHQPAPEFICPPPPPPPPPAHMPAPPLGRPSYGTCHDCNAAPCACPLEKLKNLCPGKLLCGGCSSCR